MKEIRVIKEECAVQRRTLQSVLISVLIVAAVCAVAFFGIDEGRKRPFSERRETLPEKSEWEAAVSAVDKPVEYRLEENRPVYVTEVGEKFHIYRDCTALSRSENVTGITRRAATYAGRKLCAICEKKALKQLAETGNIQ